MSVGKLAFVREEIVLADGPTVGEAMADDPWIEDDLLVPVFALDERGLPLYRLVYVETPRGHWKSGGVAAVATAEAALHPSTDVVIGAADADQARIDLENVAGYLQRNPALGSLFQSRRDELVSDNGSRIRVISSDAASAFGLGGTHRRFRVICDELTAWKSPDLWIALASASGKVADAQTIVLSNAGFDAERSWQWDVRTTAEREPWGYLFSADGVIASWISKEWVEHMRALLPAAAFDRLIGNAWTTGTGDFLLDEQWRACVDETLRPSQSGVAGQRYFAGLDLGLTKDRTALAVVHWEAGRVVLDELDVWQGSRDHPVSITAIEEAVISLATRYLGVEIYADPWNLKGSLERLRGRVRIREYTFSGSSVQKLSGTLHNAVTSGRLRVYPDAELEREVLTLRVVENASWRFDHRADGFSDRAVALAMAIQLAVERGQQPIRFRSLGVPTLDGPSLASGLGAYVGSSDWE